MNKRVDNFVNYLLIAWGYKWRALLAIIVVYSFVSSLGEYGDYLLAVLNAFGIYGISQLGVLSFCEKHVGDKE